MGCKCGGMAWLRVGRRCAAASPRQPPQSLSCAPILLLAGHFLHRGRVVGAGCLLWAAMTASFAACHSLAAGAAVWAVNGLGLALVLPNTQVEGLCP